MLFQTSFVTEYRRDICDEALNTCLDTVPVVPEKNLHERVEKKSYNLKVLNQYFQCENEVSL